jgi:hypothetical protein
MGKRRKRMTMARYAKKYANKRAALGYDTSKEENKVIEIDMLSGEEIKQKEDVQVVINTPEQTEQKKQTQSSIPEPEIQVVQMVDPVVQEAPPPVEVKKLTKKRATRKRATEKTEE